MTLSTPSLATGVSGDGSVITGCLSATAGEMSRGIRWTLAGSEDIGGGVAWASSQDGSIIVGLDANGAWKYSQSTGQVRLTGMSTAYCVSRDGLVVGGATSGAAAVWTAANGTQRVLSGALSEGVVYALSYDGSVVAGACAGSSRAFRKTNGVVEMPPLPAGHYLSIARTINSDGSLWAGVARTSDTSVDHAVRFTSTSTELMPAPNQNHGYVRGMNGNGSVAVGTAALRACVWVNGTHQTIEQVIYSAGFADPVDWQFSVARGVSDDGLIIVGEGFHFENGSWQPRGWVLNLRTASPCPVVFRGQPTSRRIGPGDDLVLSAPHLIRTPSPVRWFRDNAPLIESDRITGTRTQTLVLHDAEPQDSGRYRLVVETICGEVSSQVGTVTVALPTTVRYVDPAGSTGGTGASWQSPFNTLEPALVASLPGDEVWIRSGLLAPVGNGSSPFIIPAGVVVRGGFAGDETSPSERPADLMQSTIVSRAQRLLVSVRGTSVLDRLVIRGGRGGYDTFPLPPGIGCRIEAGDCMLVDCKIIDNACNGLTTGGAGIGALPTAGLFLLRSSIEGSFISTWSSGFQPKGANLYATGASIAIIDSVVADGLTQSLAGACSGGIANPSPGGSGVGAWLSRCGVTIRRSRFDGNISGPGSGITQCHRGPSGAAAGGDGGALRLELCTGEISRSTFWGNETGSGGSVRDYNDEAGWNGRHGGNGGAVAIQASDSLEFLTIESCIFSHNKAGDGSRCDPILWEGVPAPVAVFGGNGGNGGAIHLSGSGARIAISNCTFVGNEAGAPGPENGEFTFAGQPGLSAAVFTGGVPVSITNSVFQNNSNAEGSFDGSIDHPEFVRSSLVQSDASAANRTFTALPYFTDPLGDDGLPSTGDEDLSPRADSPLIDAGDNSVVASLFDLAGNPRIIDDPATPDSGVGTAPFVDLGAFEYQPGTNCPADINADGDTDTDDTTAFFNAWDEGHHSGDIDQDGDTDSDDIIYFFARFEIGC